ncbi:Ppx/GppA family phosphatase [Schaalia sp. ZJ405]|uniref:Ppx/GppA phosphatase family protein n=1 Tax=Schaalia sp. ZJ405 TaxID=2709403 RepID=UPI0013EB6071|nr:Ppx/GppA phosphatase family protein [Schaalia sp. ZJ405]QPK80870.1 Ppx/GppA family phosphatase [Schaalia sp. ZJ405]
MTRVAAIDCGTNSIRLLVADVEPGDPDGRPRISDLTRQMRIVRLGQDVDRTGVLDPQAIERTVEAATEYRRMIERLGAEKIRFVATSASRDARNRDDFVQAIRQVLGVEPEVIEGTEEASLSFAGAVTGLSDGAAMPMLVVDIGGGSTEFVLGSTSVRQAISVDMGGVRVTEKFFSQCPPDQGIPETAQHQAIEWIDGQLDAAARVVDFPKVKTLVGVAGTVTTVTAQALGLTSYQPERIHGARLSLDTVSEAVRFMVDQPIPVKAALGFMPQGREDVIAAGSLIWSRIVARVVAEAATEGTVIDHTVTSEHDILDGIALSMM